MNESKELRKAIESFLVYLDSILGVPGTYKSLFLDDETLTEYYSIRGQATDMLNADDCGCDEKKQKAFYEAAQADMGLGLSKYNGLLIDIMATCMTAEFLRSKNVKPLNVLDFVVQELNKIVNKDAKNERTKNTA